MKTMIAILALATVISTTSFPVCAGGHLENGHWVVTSAKREKQFNDCIKNAQEPDAVTVECLNKQDESDRCVGKINSLPHGTTPMSGRIKKSEIWR
jgi:hypothetical protein